MLRKIVHHIVKWKEKKIKNCETSSLIVVLHSIPLQRNISISILGVFGWLASWTTSSGLWLVTTEEQRRAALNQQEVGQCSFSGVATKASKTNLQCLQMPSHLILCLCMFWDKTLAQFGRCTSQFCITVFQ